MAGAGLQGCIPKNLKQLSSDFLGEKAEGFSPEEIFEYLDQFNTLPDQRQSEAFKAAKQEWDRIILHHMKIPLKSDEQLVEFGRIAANYLKQVDLLYQQKEGAQARRTRTTRPTLKNGVVTVPPGAVVSFSQKGFCLDSHLPAPKKGEKFKLQKIKDLVRPEMQEVQQALFQLLKTSYGRRKYYHIQRLIWGIQNVGKEKSSYSDPEHFSDTQKQILNKALPGGFRKYQSAREQIINQPPNPLESFKINGTALSSMDTSSLGGFAKSVANAVNPGFELPGGVRVDLLALADPRKSKGEIKSAMNAIIGAPVPGMIPNDNSHMSTLEPNVVAKTVGDDTLTPRITIANNSGKPFVFDSVEYAAIPSRRAQNVALQPPRRIDIIKNGGVSRDDRGFVLSYNKGIASDVDKMLFDRPGRDLEEKLSKLKSKFNMYKKDLVSDGLGQVMTMVPFLGSALSAYEVVTGTNWVTGEELSNVEIVLAGAGLVPGVGALVKVGGKGVTKALKLADKSRLKSLLITAAQFKDRAEYYIKLGEFLTMDSTEKFFDNQELEDVISQKMRKPVAWLNNVGKSNERLGFNSFRMVLFSQV